MTYPRRAGDVILLSLFFPLPGNSEVAETAATATFDRQSEPTSSSSCGVWFAESTIPGAGFGIFAGVDYSPGDQITPGDLVVPYLDLAWHNDAEDSDQLRFLWDE